MVHLMLSSFKECPGCLNVLPWCPRRSQPVLRVEASMEFKPKEVARSVFECRDQEAKAKPAGEARICLWLRKKTRDRLQEGEVGGSDSRGC